MICAKQKYAFWACADSEGQDQTAQMRSLIRAFAVRYQNHRISHNVSMESNDLDETLRMRRVMWIRHILRIVEGTFAWRASKEKPLPIFRTHDTGSCGSDYIDGEIHRFRRLFLIFLRLWSSVIFYIVFYITVDCIWNGHVFIIFWFVFSYYFANVHTNVLFQ